MIITNERQIGTMTVKWPSKATLPVTLQTLADDFSRFCVRFGGNGKYFQTLDEAAAYVKQRFNINLKGETDK